MFSSFPLFLFFPPAQRPYCEACRHFVAASIAAYCLFSPHPAVEISGGPQDTRFLEAMRTTRYLCNAPALQRLAQLYPLCQSHLSEFYEKIFRLDHDLKALACELRALAASGLSAIPAARQACVRICTKVAKNKEN